MIEHRRADAFYASTGCYSHEAEKALHKIKCIIEKISPSDVIAVKRATNGELELFYSSLPFDEFYKYHKLSEEAQKDPELEWMLHRLEGWLPGSLCLHHGDFLTKKMVGVPLDPIICKYIEQLSTEKDSLVKSYLETPMNKGSIRHLTADKIEQIEKLMNSMKSGAEFSIEKVNKLLKK